MLSRAQASANQGVAKVRDLLLGARAKLASDGKELAVALQAPPPPPGERFTDPIPVLNRMRENLQSLRAEVLLDTSGGAAGAAARTLSARAIGETEQSLGKLVEARLASDDGSAAALLEESIRLRGEAKKTSVLAARALGIPWPL